MSSFNFKAWAHRWVTLQGCILSLSALLLSSSVYAEGKALRFHGVTKTNTADASALTSLNKDNVADVQLYGIYNIPLAPSIPNKVRLENGVGFGVSITQKGIMYVPTLDGVMHVLDITQTDSTSPNADGTKIPKILATWDLAGDSKYNGVSSHDGDDILINRLQPALSKDLIFAGNYNHTFTIEPSQYGVPIPSLGFEPDSKGAVLYAIDRKTGDLKWKSIIDDNPHSMITNSPVVHQNKVYVALSTEMSGDLGVYFFGFIDFSYPSIYNVSGDPFLKPGDPVSKSGVMQRNALAALDVKTGKVLWKTYVMPEQNYVSPEQVLEDGDLTIWNGGSSWGGGNFPIDKKRDQIYIGTGQSYGAPAAAIACESQRNLEPGAAIFSEKCLDFNQDGTRIDLDDNEDDNDPSTWIGEEEIKHITNVPSGVPGVSSISHPVTSGVIAFDYKTGAVKWARRFAGFDVWHAACLEPFLNDPGEGLFLLTNFDTLCPSYIRENPFLSLFAKDFDIGEQPMLVRNVVMPDGHKQDILYVTSKNANIYGLDPDTGETIWGPTSFGPGSLFGGGILWGSATDEKRAFMTSTTGELNILAGLPDTVVPGSCPQEAFDPDTGALLGGIYGAVNLNDGSVAWQRCLLGQLIDSAQFLLDEDGEQVLDGQGNPVPNPNYGMPLVDENNNAVLAAGYNEGPVLYANGMVIVPGPTNAYFAEGTKNFVAEYVVLDAESGEIIKNSDGKEVRLLLNAPGEQSAFRPQYQRPAVFGNAIILGNGSKTDGSDNLARRIVIYTLGDKVVLNNGQVVSDQVQADAEYDDDSDY